MKRSDRKGDVSGAMGIKIPGMLERKNGINQFSIYASFETNMAFSRNVIKRKYILFSKTTKWKRWSK
jgi:hypothetical protein